MQQNNNKLYYPLILILSLFITLWGCGYGKQKILFKSEQKIETSKSRPVVIVNEQEYETDHKVANGDVIEVRLLNEEGVRTTYEKLAANREDAKFTVHDSVLTLPIVGKVNVYGLKKVELIKILEKEYSKHIIDPIIDVEFISLAVNVLGEVEEPGKYRITENTHLVDGIGLAGGFSNFGKYENVKIIRGSGDNQEVIVVDVTALDALTHPKLKLRDKDVIYVEPRKVKQFDNAVRPYLFLTGIVSSIATVIIVYINTQP